MKLISFLTWSANCVIVFTDVTNQGTTFSITETKLSVSVMTLSTEDNAKLLQQKIQVLKE